MAQLLLFFNPYPNEYLPDVTMEKKDGSWSKIAFWGIALLWILSFLGYGSWDRALKNGGDPWGYYAYLPATFVYQDLSTLDSTIYHRYSSELHRKPKGTTVGEARQVENGNWVIKYTCGVALMELPFFLVGHGIASIGPGAANGYSTPYSLLVCLASPFYALLGLWLLRNVLRRLSDDKIVALVLFAIGAATNLYHFTVYNPAMAHGFLFGLYGMLIFGTVKWYETWNWKFAALIGLSLGLITLIRPVELIAVVIPLSYGIHHHGGLIGHLKQLGKEWRSLVLAAMVVLIVGGIQMVYWKYITGSWLHYSYTEESFDFTNPQILKGMFGFRNGWLVYTPIMIFALLGIGFLFRKKDFLWPVILFLPIHIFIAYSWWCWYYINGFGSRPMVETYALLAIPLIICFPNFVSLEME